MKKHVVRICHIDYAVKAEDAQRRLRKGERQGQCQRCKLWFWADEIGSHKCEPLR